MNGGGNGGGGAGGAECPVSMAGSSHLQMVLQSGGLAGGALAGGARAYPAPAPAALHYGTTAPHLAYNNQPPYVLTARLPFYTTSINLHLTFNVKIKFLYLYLFIPLFYVAVAVLEPRVEAVEEETVKFLATRHCPIS